MKVGEFRTCAAILVTAAALLGQNIGPTKANVRTVEIDGRRIVYEAVDDVAIVHGDIILGTLAEVESKSDRVRAAALVVNALGQPRPWTDRVVYYTIDPGVPNQQRILSAVEHWNTRTSVRLVQRVAEPNYVQFRRVSDPGRCASAAGMIGGRQFIDTGDFCSAGTMIHEIGHAAGLMHEMIRPDRNAYVTVLYENIDPDFTSQFHPGPDTIAGGYYDYDSIMHYSARAASTNRNASIVTVPPGIPLGQNNGLSAGDIDGIERLYGVTPARTTITTIPEGLSILVDGTTYTAPRSFDWGPGQTHTVSVVEQQGTLPRYRFVRWTDGGAVSHTITTSPDRTVFAAIFRGEQRMTTGVASGAGSAAADPPSPSGDRFYPTGTPIRITATPAADERFFFWSGADFEGTGRGRATQSGLLRLYSSADFRANFTNEPLTVVTSDPPGRTVMVDGQSYLTPIAFRWLAGSQHQIAPVVSDFSDTATVEYVFDHWEDDSPSAARTVSAAPEVTTYTATYRERYYLALGSVGGGFLSTTPTSQDSYFDAGTDVTIEGVSGGGRVIQYWLGDTAGGGNTKTLRMDGSKAAYAVFGLPVPFRPVNAASYLAANVHDEPGTAIAPLEILTVFGDNVGPASATPGSIGSNGRVATSAGGTRVLFDNTPAPILYTSASQTSVVVPADVAGKTAVVIRVERDGVAGNPVIAEVTSALPAIFTANASGRGPIAIANAGAVDRGSVIVLYASGAGLMDRAMPDGAVVGADLPRPLGPVSVRIGGQPAEVFYAGGAPGLVYGALQVNVKVPDLLLPGEHAIQLVVGDWASPPGTTVAVK